MANNAIENWLPVVGYECLYEVSDLGRIWSCSKIKRANFRPFRVAGRILKTHLDGEYQGVQLTREGEMREFSVHRLVWLAFYGLIPAGLRINHKNGIKHDNRLCKLEVMTHSENIKHAYRNGLIPSRAGEGNQKAVLTNAGVVEIRRRAAAGLRYGDRVRMAAEFGVSVSTIKGVIAGKTWRKVC